MKKKQSTLPYAGTPEQEAELIRYIDEHADTRGALMTVLQKAQEIFGYLPREVQSLVAQKMDVSIEEVYGVATFYSQFALTPKGRHKISVCLGTACYVKGSQQIIDRISKRLGIGPDECTPDGNFSLEACRCNGACGLAPVLTVGDDVYGRLTEKDVDGILDKYADA